MSRLRCYPICTTWLLITCGLTGAFIFAGLFGRVDFSYRDLHMELRLDLLRWGSTILSFPPMGEVEAQTHFSPVSVRLTLTQIDAAVLSGIKTMPQKDQLLGDFTSAARRAMKRLSIKTVLLCISGAIFFAFFAGFRREKHYAAAAAAGSCVSLLLLASVYLTFSAEGFKRPKYAGMLETAPWMINLASRSLDHLQILGRQLESVAANLPELFSKMESITPVSPEDGAVRILHVSDIHNNPAAFDFISKLVTSFDVDLIIDTGDITDFGTVLEASLFQGINGLTIPYYFVPGNHDSPEVLRYLRKIGNVKILNGETTFKGIKISGIPDPASEDNTGPLVSPRKITAAARKWGDRILAGKTPDIVAVHNKDVAAALDGKVPLILHGHDHLLRVDATGPATKKIDAGTTGAAGLRGLQQRGTPYSVALLYFVRERQGCRLAVVDTVKINNFKEQFMLERLVCAE
ncbi:MAG: metallophosphoesterase family protein [Bacillota bacterium]